MEHWLKVMEKLAL